MDTTITKYHMQLANNAFDAFQHEYAMLVNEVDSLAEKFDRVTVDRDRLQEKLDLLILPDRPCYICRNVVDGACSKWSCEWERLGK
jgi:hypothetical protein